MCRSESPAKRNPEVATNTEAQRMTRERQAELAEATTKGSQAEILWQFCSLWALWAALLEQSVFSIPWFMDMSWFTDVLKAIG